MKIAVCLIIFTLNIGTAAEESKIPLFMKSMIEEYERGSIESSPGVIYQYRLDGRLVYYVAPLYCCDIPSYLYDSDGKLLCSPDGGYANTGDGKCPEFKSFRKDERVIWKDSRISDDGT